MTSSDLLNKLLQIVQYWHGLRIFVYNLTKTHLWSSTSVMKYHQGHLCQKGPEVSSQWNGRQDIKARKSSTNWSSLRQWYTSILQLQKFLSVMLGGAWYESMYRHFDCDTLEYHVYANLWKHVCLEHILLLGSSFRVGTKELLDA